MSERAAAKRYAVALFDLAKENHSLTETRAELEAVKQAFEENTELEQLLQHPKVSREKKEQIIRDSFSSVSEQVIHTLLLMLRKKRVDDIVLFVDSFLELADEEQKVGHAVVYTVKPLTESEETMISETFAKKVGKETLYITNEIDQGLVGGIKVHIGDTIFDGSVKGKLNRLERELVSGKR